MVLPAAAKRLQVVFGTFTLDETNSIALQANPRRYALRETHSVGFFSCDFVLRLTTVTGDETVDDAAMAALVNATELALSKRRLALYVKQNGTVINGRGVGWDNDPAVNSAFLIESELEKIGHPADNGRRRTYRFSVRCQLQAEATYNYRRDGAVKTITGVNGNRVCLASGVWSAYASATALQSYATNGPGYFTGVLPVNVTNGEWVQVSEDPVTDDETAMLQVTRVYWEVVRGQREYQVDVDQDGAGRRSVVISGFYMTTSGASARTNYTSGIAAFVTSILNAEGGQSLYEGVSTPKLTGYDTTGKLYRFRHTYREILYPESLAQTDDPNVSGYTLRVSANRNFLRQTTTTKNPVSRLRKAFASYTAVIDHTSSGGTDPRALWDSKLRTYVVIAVGLRMGSLSVSVESEVVSVSLDGNVLNAELELLVRGGNVLSLAMRQSISRTPAWNPASQASGKPHEYWPYWDAPARMLQRVAVVEYVSGQDQPELWNRNEAGSGFAFLDTGKSAEEVLDAIEQGTLPAAPCWVPVRPGLREDNFPGSRGENDSLQTVIYTREETWLYVKSWATQRTLSAPSGGSTRG